MDFSEIERKYQGPGHPAYHPKVMLKLLIMGAIDGIRSSRKIARMARENVVYMFLAGMLKPDFRTISDFRKNNADLISAVFKKVVDYARDAGLIKLGHVSIDGTKIRANASNEKYLKKEEVKLLERILEEIKEGIRVDEKEDEEFDPDGYEMDEKAMEKLRELRRKRKGKLEKMLKEDIDKLEDKIEKMKGNKASKISTTDPECRFMRSGGLNLCYNAQISIDSYSGVIIARDVVNDNVDCFQLIPQLEQVKANLRYPSEVSADNGYYTTENLIYLAEKGIEAYIPDNDATRSIKGRETIGSQKDKLKYNAKDDCFECEYGRITFRYRTHDRERGKDYLVYKGENCKGCPIQKECVKNKKGIKIIKCYIPEKIRIEMQGKMRGEEGKRKYKLRKKLEKVFGHIKHNMGLRQFLTRGIEKVRVEFDLACIAYNLRRIWNIRMSGKIGE